MLHFLPIATRPGRKRRMGLIDRELQAFGDELKLKLAKGKETP